MAKNTLPTGWDETTYNNFKVANPTLEPDAIDTGRMQGAPSYNTSNGLLTDFGRAQGLQEVNLPSNLNSMNASRAGSGSITTPMITANNSSAGSLEAIGAITAANTKAIADQAKVDAETAALAQDQKVGKSAIASIYEKLSGKSAEKENLYKASGIDTAKQSVDELTSQIEAEQLSTRRKVESLEKNNPNGLFGGALEQEKNRINNESLMKQADLSIVQNAALRKYSTLKDIADRKIESETADLKTELEGLTFFYNENKESLNKKDQRAYEEAIKAKDREYQETYDTKKKLSDTKIELLQSAAEQGAPTFVLQGIQNAKTPEESITAAGQYAGDILERKIKLANLQNIYADTAEKNAEAIQKGNLKDFKTPPIINPSTGKPDPTSQLASVIQSTGIKDNTNLQNILGVVASTQQLAESNPDGKFPGVHLLGFSTSFPNFNDAQGQSNVSAIEAINLKVQQWASGAALTEEQTKKVNRLTPVKGDTNNQIKNKINALADFMQSQAQSILVSQGINYKPQKIDYFKPVVTDEQVKSMDDVLK